MTYHNIKCRNCSHESRIPFDASPYYKSHCPSCGKETIEIQTTVTIEEEEEPEPPPINIISIRPPEGRLQNTKDRIALDRFLIDMVNEISQAESYEVDREYEHEVVGEDNGYPKRAFTGWRTLRYRVKK